MPSIQQKFADTGFTVWTALGFDDVVRAADDVAGRSAGIMTKIVRTGVHGGTIYFAVRRVGLLEVGSFTVVYVTRSEGSTVSVVPGDFITSQPTVLLIPIGPKSSAALTPARTFSGALRAAVERR